jgi:hypothetical protein
MKAATRAYTAATYNGNGIKTIRVGEYLNGDGKSELLNHSVRVSIKFGSHNNKNQISEQKENMKMVHGKVFGITEINIDKIKKEGGHVRSFSFSSKFKKSSVPYGD